MDRPRTLTFENGAKAQPTFSAEEMNTRLAKLRAHMDEHDIGHVLFTSIHNINYFADFVYCSFGRPYGLVVTPSSTTTISANIDAGQPWRQSFGDNLVYTDWQRGNYFSAVQQLIRDGGRIGIELDHVSVQFRDNLARNFPRSQLVDVGEPTMRMRMLKSDEELELIRNGARIADLGGEACIAAIGEGVAEYEVALASTQSMIREIAATYPHTELMDTWTWFQSGPNTDGAHNPVTTRRIQKGDILSMNCFPMISGYYHALERTLFFDSASDRALELWEVNCAVHRAGCRLIRPGARCGDIAAELNEIYAACDLLQYRTFGYGHSFGTLCHYYGREAGLELREDVDTVLEPKMVVSMEPMLTIPEGEPGAGGYREHDILIVTEDGADNITGFPFGPERNVIKA